MIKVNVGDLLEIVGVDLYVLNSTVSRSSGLSLVVPKKGDTMLCVDDCGNDFVFLWNDVLIRKYKNSLIDQTPLCVSVVKTL